MNRFRGAAIAVFLLVVVAGASLWIQSRTAPPAPPSPESNQLFSFEEEDLVGVLVERPDSTVEYAKRDGQWVVVDRPWVPSETMLRRVAHQLHALEARARVAGSDADPEQFGLGPTANRVTLTLTPAADGSERMIRFRTGDPNPSSVSFYIQPEGGDVYIVQKAAVDYYSLSLDEFRERRFASVNADEVDAITARIGERELAFRRLAEKRWLQESPVRQGASLSKVRTMVGRSGALKARTFVEDSPKDLSKFGLDQPHAVIRFGLSGGETITLHVGDVASIEGEEREHRYVYRVEHDSVYTARAGFLEAFAETDEAFRNRQIVQRENAALSEILVEMDGESIRIRRSGARDWLWEDSSPISGSTARRLATQSTGQEALRFFDDGAPKEAGLDSPQATVTLFFGDEDSVTIRLGESSTVDEEGGEERFIAVEGDPVAYSTADRLFPILEDLVREHRRKVERDAEKAIREVPPEEQ